MYFWTNTPNQVAFIGFAADVNRFNAYINDPNVSEEQSQIYQVEFIAAKAKMALSFLLVKSDWEEWLFNFNLSGPTLALDGTIRVLDFAGSNVAFSLEPPNGTGSYQGEEFHWQDFLRTLALEAFLLRSEPGAEHAKYHPESYFDEPHTAVG